MDDSKADVHAEPRDYLIPVLLGGIFILFFLLRLRYLPSIPVWDEARHILIVRALASGNAGAILHDGIYFHPPFYLLMTRLGMAVFGESINLYRLISLAFASGSFFVLYFMVREVSGRATAVLACLALALLPAASSYDAWIKEDAVCVFWVLCTLLAFVRRRYPLSGVFFGLALLSKENAVMVLLVLPVYLLVLRAKKEEWRGLAVTAVLGGALSFWWYAFFSESGGSWLGFFTGSNVNASEWSQPWHYYFSGSVADLGWPLLLLAVWGTVRAVRAWSGGDRRALLPVVWVLACYVFLSFSSGKPPWMVTIALPAWAWLAGSGMLGMYGFFAARGRGLAVFVAVAAIVAMIAVNLHQGGSGYLGRRYREHLHSAESFRNAAVMVGEGLPEGSVMVTLPRGGLVNPVFLYYLRPDIRPVIIPFEYASEGRVIDLLGLWSGEGANAGFFSTDDFGTWVTQQYYLNFGDGLELIRNPYGYLLVEK